MGLKRRLYRVSRQVPNVIAQCVRDPRVQARLQVGSSLSLGIGILLSALFLSGLLENYQNRFSDFLYQPKTSSGQVVLVLIDDASLAEVGPWPWSRGTLLDLLRRLTLAQPRAVALDIQLPNFSPDGTPVTPIAGASNIVLPMAGTLRPRSLAQANSFPRFEPAPSQGMELLIVGAQFGHTLIVPDADGIVRRIAVAVSSQEREYTALGISAVLAGQDGETLLKVEDQQVSIGGRPVPTDGTGNMYINFTAPSGWPTYSASDALFGRVNPALLRDKIILVGQSRFTSDETFNTPLAFPLHRASPTQIQADVVETLLKNNVLADQDQLTQMILILLVAILAGATLPHVGFLSAIGLAILYLLAYLGYAFQMYGDGILVQPLYPILALALTSISTITYRHLVEERPKALIQNTFREQVSPDSMDRVLSAAEGGVLSMQGVRREVTVLFVDLRELVEAAPSLSAAATLERVNRCNRTVESIVFENEGAIVTRTGSSVVAVWDLPLYQPQHASLAIRAGILIRRRINLAKDNGDKFAVGIGIATGCVVAGRLSTPRSSTFTLVGEIVNIAERLAARRDGGVFINAAAREQSGSVFETRPLDALRLRRRGDPIEVWEVVEPSDW